MTFVNFLTTAMMACLCLVSSKTLAQPTPELTAMEARIDALRKSGQYWAAIKTADAAIGNADNHVDRLVLNLSKTRVCREIEHYECFTESLSAANEIYEGHVLPDSLQGHFLKRLNIWFGVVDWYFGDYEQLVERAYASESISFYEVSLEDFFQSHRFAAVGYHLLNRPFEARRSISRMVHGLMASHAFSETRPSDDVTARGLAQIVHLTHILGDNLYSRRLMSSLDEFILSSIPKETFPYADYLVHTSEILARADTLSDFEAAISRLEEAHSIFSDLQVTEDVRQYRLAYIKVLQTAYALQIGDIELAEKFHAENPSKFEFDESLEDQAIDSVSHAYHAVATTLIGKLKNEIFEEAWVKLFSQATPFENSGSQDDRYYKLLRLYALGIAKQSRDSDAGFSELAQSAEEIVEYIEDRAAGFSGLFPLPRFVDRFILADFIRSASGRNEFLPLAFQSAQLLQRNSRHTTGDYLYAKSLLEDETERRLVHQWRSLNQGMRQVELDGLAVLANPKATKTQIADYRQAHQELVELIDQSRFGLVNYDPTEEDDRLLPSVEDVQARLSPDEALLLQTSYLNELISFCVRKNEYWLSTKNLTQENLLDFKLLQLSLTATHPPNLELDAQFPLEASHRSYETLLKASEPCLVGVSKIIYIPSAKSAGLPIEALITEPITQAGASKKLSEQPWFLKKASVRYSGSIQEFLAGSGPGSTIGGSFLGIGDPQLGSNFEIASTRSPSSLSALVDKLPALPNTRDELSSVSSFFQSSELLVGAEATEQGFRNLTTTGVDVISFATHGLISGELTGLDEPALVLTPPKKQLGGVFTVNDGLLTGSEVANLNLDAGLAILSACNTANYDTSVFASGLRSLSNAFQISGVKSVLASLWPVETFSSEYQVTRFAELALAEGKALDDALRLAKLDLMISNGAKYAHPRFWAPFVLIGNASSSHGRTDEKREVVLEGLERDDDPGSEYVFVDTNPDGAIATSKIGKWNGDRASSVIAVSRPGQDEAELVSATIGAGIVSITSKFLVKAGTTTPKDDVVSSSLSVFDVQGDLLWSWDTYPVDGSFSVILDAKIEEAEDGTPLVVALVRRECCYERHLKGILELFWLFDGEVIRQDTLDEKNADFSYSEGWIFERETDFLVVHSLRSPPATDFVGSSDLAGVADPCAGNFETRVYKMTKSNAAEVNLTITPGVRTRSAVYRGDKVILAGSEYSRCEDNGQAFVGEIKNQHGDIQRLWIEPQLVNSEALYANEVGDSLIVVSDWTRKFSSRAIIQGEKSIGFGPNKPRAENAYQTTETVVSKVSDGGGIERAFLSSASSVHPMAARLDGRKIFVYGAYSNSAMIGEFRW